MRFRLRSRPQEEGRDADQPGRRLPPPSGTDGRRSPRDLYFSLPDARSATVNCGLLETVSGSVLMTRPDAATVELPVPELWSVAWRAAAVPTAPSRAPRPTRHPPLTTR